MSRLNDKLIFTLQDEVALEDFDEGSLLLLSRQLRLIKLSRTARYILGLVDGRLNLKQITTRFAQDFNLSIDQSKKDVNGLFLDLGSKGILKPLIQLSYQRKDAMNESTKIMANPDVSCREEPPEGAVLFNADSDDLQVINPIGLIIWRFLCTPRTQRDILQHLIAVCTDVPEDHVIADIKEFIDPLIEKGFIGEVLEENAV
jgi:hypothetical protein